MSITPEEIERIRKGSEPYRGRGGLFAIVPALCDMVGNLRAELARVMVERDEAVQSEAELEQACGGLDLQIEELRAERDAALSKAESARREGIESAIEAALVGLNDLANEDDAIDSAYIDGVHDSVAAIRALLDAPADGKREGE